MCDLRGTALDDGGISCSGSMGVARSLRRGKIRQRALLARVSSPHLAHAAGNPSVVQRLYPANNRRGDG